MRSRFYRPRRAEAVSADLAVAVFATRGQFVLECGDGLAPVGALTWEVRDRTGQFAHRTGDRDAEHALPALQQVDDFLGRRALIDRGAVREQGDVRQIANPALAQMV